jgi:phosphatidate cytidylyltransferase
MITSWIKLPPLNSLYVIGFVFFLMSLISVWLLLLKHFKPHKNITELTLRVKTFWIIIILLSVSLIVAPTIAIIFWAIVSYLALKEYFTIIPTRHIDRRVLFWAYIAIPIQYYWIASGWYSMFAIFIPVYVFLFLPLRMVTLGETKGFLRAVGTLHWGVMMMVYCMSCIAALYMLDPQKNLAGGIPGLILYLLFLNQLNDVAQFFWGKNIVLIKQLKD